MTPNEIRVRVFHPPLPGLPVAAVLTHDNSVAVGVPGFEQRVESAAQGAFAALDTIPLDEAAKRVSRLPSRAVDRYRGDVTAEIVSWRHGPAAAELGISTRSGERRMWLEATVAIPRRAPLDDEALTTALSPLLEPLARL